MALDRRYVAMLALIACGVPPVVVEPPSNTAPAPLADREPHSGDRRRVASKLGAIEGHVIDGSTHSPAAGATLVATSPALMGEKVVLSGDDGRYTIDELPSGRYTLTIYFDRLTLSAPVAVAAGFATTENVLATSTDVRMPL